jgi:hypothetical protein
MSARVTSRNQRVLRIFVKVTSPRAVISGLNKLTQHHVSRAASVAAVLLLPSMAATESRVQTAVPDAPLAATAHVNFKIVIPTVLSLEVGTGGDHTLGAETVAIVSNSHNVTLNATVRTPDSPAHGNVILSAALRKIIAQDAQCSLGPGRPAASPGAAPGAAHAGAAHAGAAKAGGQQVLCTVSIP